MINKYKYLPAYRPAAKLSMYQPAQTIEALTHVGRRVVKIVPENGAERKHLYWQLTNLLAASRSKVSWLQAVVRLHLPGNGSQYAILNLPQQAENCFHQSRGDIA
jgi:hypothetical protein